MGSLDGPGVGESAEQEQAPYGEGAPERSGVPGSDRPVRRLTGVYHAKGTVLGELRYLVGRALGNAHCALCDITHGSLRLKRTWSEATAGIPVPFDRVHLDERSPEVAAVSEGVTPCVVAHTDDGVEVVLGPAQLAACRGEPDRLVEALAASLERRGLVYAERA